MHWDRVHVANIHQAGPLVGQINPKLRIAGERRWPGHEQVFDEDGLLVTPSSEEAEALAQAAAVDAARTEQAEVESRLAGASPDPSDETAMDGDPATQQD